MSGTFVSAQDVTATWLMHDLGASAFALSLMATAASAPFFLFTPPAGAIADIVNRRVVIVSAVLWQAACSAVLAVAAWTHLLAIPFVLTCIFLLGVGLAFGAPVWGAIVPDIVDKEELPSAITLGGVQLNLSGIIGPALGGLLLPLLGPPLLISLNALTFVVVAFVVLQWKPKQTPSSRLRENFTESFISSLRYARNSQRMKVILFRNVLFSVVISVIPALLPVVALKGSQFFGGAAGFDFYLRGHRIAGRRGHRPAVSPGADYAERDHFDGDGDHGCCAGHDGFRAASISIDGVVHFCRRWALAGSEIWVAGQRVMPGWVRGRMNSFQIMIGQGSMALAAVAWGAGASHFNLDLTFAAAAATALVALILGRRFSINFAAEAVVDAAPISHQHEFPVTPDDDDGPVTVTIDYNIMNDDREQFRVLMQEVQATCRRNGAFQCRLDESLELPGTFRLEYIVSTWAEHLRQNMRMTIDETEVFQRCGNCMWVRPNRWCDISSRRRGSCTWKALGSPAELS